MRYLVLLLIKFYQKCISPLKPPCCRFYPTCSNYAVTAVKRFGAFRGTYLAVKRLLRCHPWNIGGVDYVPEEFPGIIRKKKYTVPGDDSVLIYSRKGKNSL
ncbi:MAG: membrane protein insertion efficiency factor YidD [Ruminococcus sp.]